MDLEEYEYKLHVIYESGFERWLPIERNQVELYLRNIAQIKRDSVDYFKVAEVVRRKVGPWEVV